MLRSKFAARLAIALLSASSMAATAAHATEPPLKIQWSALVPKDKPAAPPNKTFFAGAAKVDPAADPQAAQLPEGKFMSLKRRQPGNDRPPAVVSELNGKRVQLGGFVVPLDFEATNVKEFLLVPFVGACIHVPPPPANQIVYVKTAAGLDIANTFDAVSVTGTLKTDLASTDLADAGYTIEAENVEPYKK
mgnify:CR=1 FL=1